MLPLVANPRLNKGEPLRGMMLDTVGTYPRCVHHRECNELILNRLRTHLGCVPTISVSRCLVHQNCSPFLLPVQRWLLAAGKFPRLNLPFPNRGERNKEMQAQNFSKLPLYGEIAEGTGNDTVYFITDNRRCFTDVSEFMADATPPGLMEIGGCISGGMLPLVANPRLNNGKPLRGKTLRFLR